MADLTHKFGNQQIACLALHLQGESWKKPFRNIPDSARLNFLESGYRLYGNKFNEMLTNSLNCLEKHLLNNFRVLTIVDEIYPDLLKTSINPPLAFFYAGNVDLLGKQCLAIVGTRNPSPITIRWVECITEFLGENGYCIVSGLAKGIDYCVHKSALSTGTIGVSPQSLDIEYPINNKDIYAHAKNHDKNVLIISEYPVTTVARKFHFRHRNRIIAGLCPITIFAEGGRDSGAMITANWCIKNNRTLYAIFSKMQGDNSGALYLMENNLGIDITCHLPLVTMRHSFDNTDRSIVRKGFFYIGASNWVKINKNCFSLKFLSPDQQDQDFER